MELTPLEKEYVEAYNAVKDRIEELEEQASKALAEAVKLCEEHGVCWRFGVSPLSNNYEPESFRKKFTDIEEFWNLHVGDGHGNEYGPGWQHSAVCY